MKDPSPLVWIAIALLVAGVIWLNWYYTQKRRKELAAWAAQRGLGFEPGRDEGFEAGVPEFSFLQQGYKRYAYNTCAGRIGAFRVCATDWHYCTESRDSDGRRHDNHHHVSLVIITPDFPLKPLLIRREHLGDKIGEFFGADDIDFESAEFSRRFFVKSPDRRWAFDVIHQEAMEFLLSAPQYAVEFLPGGAIAHDGTKFTLGEFDAALGVLTHLVDHLPPSVVEELKTGRT